MDIVFAFDSEDFLTPEAADAEKWWAETLRERGVRGCFHIVAELLRSLKRNGRNEVIDAFRHHEIEYHSNYHSLPPTIPEMIEGEDFAQSIELVLRSEASGISELVDTFGRVPVSYCSPGDSWTPATLVAMSLLGIKGFSNTLIAKGIPTPYWYCGLMNFSYDLAFESFFGREDEEFQNAFDKILEAIKNRGSNHIVIFTHPTLLLTKRFWDEIFFNGNEIPPNEGTPAPLRKSEEIEANKKSVCRWLDWLLSRSDLNPTTYSELYANHSKNRMDLQALMDKVSLKPGDEGGLVDFKMDMPPYISEDEIAKFKYKWPIYKDGFTGQNIIEQAKRLAWTTAPTTN